MAAKNNKRVWWWVGGFFICGAIGAFVDDNKRPQGHSEATQASTLVPAAPSSVPSPISTVTPTATPSASATPAGTRLDQIKQLAGQPQAFGAGHIRNVFLDDGLLRMEVDLQDSLTPNLIRRHFITECRQFTQQIMARGDLLKDVTSFGYAPYFPVMDKFGRESVERVGWYLIDRSDAEKIVWDNIDNDMFTDLAKGHPGNYYWLPPLQP